MGQNSKKSSITMKLGDKTFIIKLLPHSIRDDYKKYLISATYTQKGETKNLKKSSQKNYLEKLEEFIYNELEPLDIAEKFDIYKVDSIEALKCLHKTMYDKTNPLYRLCKNDYRKKNNKAKSYCDKSVANYLGGDPRASLTRYIEFLSERLK